MLSWNSQDAKCDFTATIQIELPFNVIQEILIHKNYSVIHKMAQVIWMNYLINFAFLLFLNFLIIQLFLAR